MTSGQLKVYTALLFLYFSFLPAFESNAATIAEPSPTPSNDLDEIKPGPPDAPPRIEPTHKLQVERNLYLDLYAILAEDNQCSQFFRGSGAVEVLNELSKRFIKKPLNVGSIGVQMTGVYGSFGNFRTGYTYRMFEKAILNTDGPFFRNNCAYSEQCQRTVGSFRATTREGRILMILHEMAHLIKDVDGKWLIPDDGHDNWQSIANTLTVEKQCHDAIIGVTKR